MSLPQVGKIYTFTCMVFPDKKLNLYGSASNGKNVVMWDEDGSLEQQWKYDSSGKLLTMKDTSFVLDRYAASGTQYNNADVWTNDPDEDANQIVAFEETIFPNTVKIRLASTNLYLRANSGNGSSNGKSTTSAGNAYWDVSVGEDNELWVFSEVGATSGDEDDEIEESNYSTGYYRLSNGGYYLTGTTNSVTAAAVNGQTTQTWNFRNNKLYTESSSSYGVAGTSSATMSTSPNGVVLVSAGTNKCYIKLSGSNKYLQRSSTTVSWGTTPTEWTIEEVVRKIGVPHMGTEYFSKDSGLSNGIWFDSYSDIVRNFYKKVYDVDTVSDANCFYNLYGALMVNSGCFHCGIDMKLYDGAPIKAPFSGKVTRISENYGRVYLYNQALNVTFVFLHMAISQNISKDDVISEGTIIGTQSGYGKNSSPDDFGSHLHVEIHTGEHDGGASVAPEYSYKALGNSLEPYEWLGQV